jgi:hypothetical protein
MDSFTWAKTGFIGSCSDDRTRNRRGHYADHSGAPCL